MKWVMTMTNDWAPEPWEVDKQGTIRNKDGHIKTLSPWHEDAWEDDAEALANMKRAAACVSACAGVPTAVLENKGFCKWLLHAVEYQEAKRQMTEKHKEATDGQDDRSTTEAD